MDLKDIESWGRELLEHEAGKRGVRSPQVYSRTELVRLILKHDYGAPRNVKEAARLIGGLLGSAREVLKKRLGPLQTPGVKTYVGAAKEPAWGGSASRADARTGGTAEVERGVESPAKDKERAGAGAADDLERSYVGDRKLGLPTSAEAARVASSSTTPDIEHSYVGGRKLDLSGIATSGASARDGESARERSLDDADAVRAAEQARAEARELRRESERVRSDSRATSQHEAERPRPDPGWHRVRLGRDLPPTAAKPVATRGESPLGARDVDAPRGDAQLKIFDTGAVRGESATSETAHAPPAAASSAASAAHLRLVEPLPASVGEVQPASAEPVAEAQSAPESTEQLTYGPHPQDGLLLRWRVTSEAIDRARLLLGAKGELALRIVAVRVDPHAVVKTEVIDHGPVSEAGDWTAPLPPTEAKYVSSIGLRSATNFVSIAHAKS